MTMHPQLVSQGNHVYSLFFYKKYMNRALDLKICKLLALLDKEKYNGYFIPADAN